MRPDVPSINLSRRGKIVIGVVVSLFILLSILGSLANTYTQWLWFGEVHFRNVFSTILWTRVVLFVVFGAVMGLTIALNIWLAYRMRPPFRPISQEQENLERYRVALEPQKKWIFAGVVAVSWFAAGMAAQQSWRTWELFRFGGKFGVKDPQFHRDISFFAWDYPTYRLLLGFGFNAVIFSLLLSLVVHYLFGAVRIATPGPRFTISARRHATVLVFLFIVLKAISYWLDRYGLVFSTRGKVSGASYTDVNASLPAKTILFWAAVLIALAVLASLWLKSGQIAGISFAVLLILSIGINGIYPAIVQSVTVKPNAIDKESKYIARNIDATRVAYGINSTSDQGGGAVTYKPYETAAAAPPAGLLKDTATVGNIRITDPSVVPPVFANFQALRSYYGFPSKLDLDRYTVNGVTSDFVVGVRELDASNLNSQTGQTGWISKHTVLTHGYGLVAVKADREVIGSSSDFDEGNIPVQGFVKIDQPRVYYGELGVDYSIVGAPGTRELDGNDARSTYDGKGGIKLGFFNRLAFAIKYRETNFLLNDAVSAKGAKIIFDRDPRQRVQKIAPFLQVDSDPFPTVVNGRIVWMLDGYTTMTNYPYSERRSFGTLTADSLTTSNKVAGQPNGQINYIRNSVKATVDAYDGTVHLYAWDEQDPVLKAWRKVFPNVVEPRSAMDAVPGLLDHVRYPTDMFEVQRGLLDQYHVSDPKTFYAGTDQWTVPNDPTTGGQADQPPYYVLAGANAGSGTTSQFQLTSAMKANNRNVMAAYISVNSQAGDNYGKMTILTMPSDTSIQGPEQVFNAFNSETAISKDITLLSGQGSSVVHGNLLSLPIGNTFLYVEPLYVQGSQGSQSYPKLQRVLVSYDNNLGYGCSLAMALRNVDEPVKGSEIGTSACGATSGSTGGEPTTTPTTTPTSTPTPTTTQPNPGATDVASILSQLDGAFADLQAAYRSGDFAKIGAAQGKVQQLTSEYLKARSASPRVSSSPSASRTSSTPNASPSTTHS